MFKQLFFNNNFKYILFYRYVDRVKKIKNKVVVNENLMDKFIRELREENEKFKKMFEGGGLFDFGVGVVVMSM